MGTHSSGGTRCGRHFQTNNLTASEPLHAQLPSSFLLWWCIQPPGPHCHRPASPVQQPPLQSLAALPFLCRGLFHKSLLVLLALSHMGSPRLRIASCHTLAKSTALNKSAAPLDARLRLGASEHGQHNPGLYPPPAQSCKHRTFVCGAEFTRSSPTE